MARCFIVLSILLFLGSCKSNSSYSLVLHFNFDSTQTRLDNLGNPSIVPSDHAAQSPQFKTLGVHFIELISDKYTAPGKGLVLYKTPEDSSHGALAIDFSQESLLDQSVNTIQISSNLLKEGKYEYIRISLGYQRYDVNGMIHLDTMGIKQDLNALVHVSSFVGFNTYVQNHTIQDSVIALNKLLPQGSWLAEVKANVMGYLFQKVYAGKAPATTVVNPLFASSPIPSGSCLVTAGFDGGSISIPKTMTSDIHVQVGISINQSFEWKDDNKNKIWDIYPVTEQVADMGIRGMKAKLIN